MPIRLDARGYVFPYTAVKATLKEMKETFVDRFPGSQTRLNLFAGYTNFCSSITKIIGPHTQWVDGSFTSGKRNPGDIDVLCFVHADITIRKSTELERFLRTARDSYDVDLYIIQTYPSDHKEHRIFEMDRVYWLNHFTKTKKMGHRKVQYDKGFL